MTPIPTVWWLRPVSKAARVGAHSAVVWKRLYFRPFPASRSAVGVAHGPPNALEAANPTSSSRTISTFGARGGGRSGSIAGNFAPGSFASRGSSPSYGRSGIGRTSRERWSVTRYSSQGTREPGTEIGSALYGPTLSPIAPVSVHPADVAGRDHHPVGMSACARSHHRRR